MWDFNIGGTLWILMRTLPFIILRMAIYFGITITFILTTGLGAGIGYGIGSMGNDPESFTVWGGIFGFGLVAGGVYWIREWLLYMVKAAHIAVMVRLIDGQPMPDGKSQITHGRETVAARFGEANVLFALDQLIRGVISVITGIIGGIAAFLPIPGLDTVAGFLNTVIRLSLTYVDEIILGYNMRLNSQNPWETSRQGLVLYAQNGKTMIRNAVWLSVFLWLFSLIIFILALAPAAAALYYLPGEWAGYAFVLAIVFAWSFKAAVLEPFAIAALMAVYFKAIEGQAPNPEWDSKLSGASEKFREIKDKALGGAGSVPEMR
ncbi:hypothetical protein [Pararhizobium sp.]|uniref:hypothetical protein n=1 Tax=Pararhizobium sp. TaxID=1977563 RepID=UPI0027197374|nr:hypothetical protein [Pararhizobium sp.]MDO9415744.1 hypothetical protein [Pararhizobium sp.]